MYLYIHIPFCESRCRYCRFASTSFFDDEKIKKYIEKLIEDIDKINIETSSDIVYEKNFTNSKKRKNDDTEIFLNIFNKSFIIDKRLKSIYFGGGTPASIDQKYIGMIIHKIREKFDFAPNIEITLESTPQNIIPKNIKYWKDIGINRISIGVQSLNNKTLKIIGRNPNRKIFEALDNLGNARFDNVSIDLIIGLPLVRKGETLRDIKLILKKYDFIKHFSVYMLEEYYDYPRIWQEISIGLGDYLEEYSDIRKYLENKEYHRYEVSNYAKNGYICSHNQAYWSHEDVVGIGLGSHSHILGRRYAYADNFTGYYKGDLEYDEILTRENILQEKIIFCLRTSGITEELIPYLDQDSIDNFLQDGYLKKEKGVIKLTDKGVLILDYILYKI